MIVSTRDRQQLTSSGQGLSVYPHLNLIALSVSVISDKVHARQSTHSMHHYNARTHTCRHTLSLAPIRQSTPTCSLVCSRALTNERRRATQAYIGLHILMNARTHIHAHRRTHARRHTHTRTHAHTHARTHARTHLFISTTNLLHV